MTTGHDLPARHTFRCVEAMACGHPSAHCVCSDIQREHEDWTALKCVLWTATKYGPNNQDASLDIARSKAALIEWHERIAARARDEEGAERGCPVCALEDGP